MSQEAVKFSVYTSSRSGEALGAGVKDSSALVLTSSSGEWSSSTKFHSRSGVALNQGLYVGVIGAEVLELVGGHEIAEFVLVELLGQDWSVLDSKLEGDNRADVAKDRGSNLRTELLEMLVGAGDREAKLASLRKDSLKITLQGKVLGLVHIEIENGALGR